MVNEFLLVLLQLFNINHHLLLLSHNLFLNFCLFNQSLHLKLFLLFLIKWLSLLLRNRHPTSLLLLHNLISLQFPQLNLFKPLFNQLSSNLLLLFYFFSFLFFFLLFLKFKFLFIQFIFNLSLFLKGIIYLFPSLYLFLYLFI